jgi:hypothetical protein
MSSNGCDQSALGHLQARAAAQAETIKRQLAEIVELKRLIAEANAAKRDAAKG